MSTSLICPHCSSLLDGASTATNTIQPPSAAAERLANSNEPPLDSSQDYENNLAQTQAHLKLVAAEIARMEKNLRVLQEKRDRLNGFVDTYKRILQPIRRLPEDVLREVFRMSTDDGSSHMDLFRSWKGVTTRTDSLSPHQTPWKLGQISHHWREVALSYSLLWSFVAIDFPDPRSTKRCLSGMGSQLVRQLQRSGRSKLTVSLHSDYLLDANDPFLMAICSHCDRWVALRARFSPQNLQSLGNFIRGAIPNLHRLYLRNANNQAYQPTELKSIAAFELAPGLRDVTIKAQCGLESLPIPWSQITLLRTPEAESETSAKYCYLRNMPNLHAFFVFITGLATRNYSAAPAPPFLRILTIHSVSTSYEDIENVLARLNPHSLWELRISARLLPSFRAEIPAGVGKTLRLLCLKVQSLTSADAVRIFTSLPALESLSLCNIRNEGLSDLASRDPSTGKLRFLPRLLDLGLYASEATSCDVPALLRLLENRFRHGSGFDIPTNEGEVQLQSVRIHRNISLPESSLQQLEILVSEGLHVDTSPPDWVHLFPGF
ncbi:hypothetical protein V5O48_011470 [Marasmius crinis-equi]|uniref:F-box domain-containing protein n=1 Tax=Marasmius crinis-equi TaxID=585013 RepID=A0ABR3F5G0_9AGAR